MRIAVTGAAGFTGCYMLAALAARDHQALPVTADVTDATALQEELAVLSPDAVVHLAALAFVHSDDYAGFYAVNQIGTFNLLHAAARAAPGCTVLLASSAQVYGAGASGLVTEDHPLAPANHYALSKWAMEMGAPLVADGLRLIVARPFNYTGRGQQDRYLIPKIVDHVRRRAPVIELGNIDVRRDVGDVRAVVDAYARLLEAPGAGGVFNVATGRAHSVRQIIECAQALGGHTMRIDVNPAFVRSNDVSLMLGDPSRLLAAVPNWRPREVEDTLAWMLAEDAPTP